MKSIPVAAVVGPTASGKTALAVELALRLNGEVISADSMQIYRQMDIATAKPDEDEMRGVTHHLIDFLDPAEPFSVARFVELARPLIDEITARGKLPIVAGGTGLYIDALFGNLRFEDEEADPALREGLKRTYETEGFDGLLERLRTLDPESAERLAPGRNPRRVIRALEMCLSTGMTQTELNARRLEQPSPYRTVKLGLRCADRAFLYERIDRRVDWMLEKGLVDEARAFYRQNAGATAAAAIGYKELKPYLDGESDLDTCTESLKRATRRYAKRQLTWFSRDPQIHWFEIDTTPFDEIAEEGARIIKDNFYE